MRIILEGCDGSGKSTFAESLASKYHCDILHMTRWSDKKFCTYVEKMSMTDNIIFDRCFISEYIYSRIFNRITDISDKDIKTLLNVAKALDYHIFILTCDDDELMKRLSDRNNETSEIIDNAIKINNAYFDFAKKYNIKLIRKENMNEYI